MKGKSIFTHGMMGEGMMGGKSIKTRQGPKTKSFGYQVLGFGSGGAAAAFVTATGGNATLTCGCYKTHVFTSPGTFCVSCAGNAGGSDAVEYLVVAGGGGGGAGQGGGGGAGGLRTYTSISPASPVNAPAGLSVSVTGYPITIGGGGAGSPPGTVGASGVNTVFSTITSAGGGGGGTEPSSRAGIAGGSGGGGGGQTSGGGAAGAGNTPPVSPSQGNPGSSSLSMTGGKYGGGGGGAGQGPTGAPANPANKGVYGGDGTFIGPGFIGPTAPSYGTTDPSPTPGRYFAGGGQGRPGCSCQPFILGGGGVANGGNGTVNTGGGGAGTEHPPFGDGGSGIALIRYKYQ